MFRKRSIPIIAVLATILFLAGTASFAQELPEIQAAIKAKGQKWIAGETSPKTVRFRQVAEAQE